ncbi:hypothetical protein [Aquisalimonas sp.]|uniref:hypothetical protein n=1 Tax=Aquisalimonas sp. TaxID=1872621 RepID=UPI0025C3035C|nr:hypothetical protein [Aquisalimonas sp.]
MNTHAGAEWLARRESPDQMARPAALLPPLMAWVPAARQQAPAQQRRGQGLQRRPASVRN